MFVVAFCVKVELTVNGVSPVPEEALVKVPPFIVRVVKATVKVPPSGALPANVPVTVVRPATVKVREVPV